MTIANEETAGLPDMKISIRQVFGFDSDMEVPAYSEPDEHVPDIDPDYLLDRKCGRAIEQVVRIDVGDVLVGLGIGRHLHVAVDAEQLPDRHFHVRLSGQLLVCDCHCSSVASERSRPASVGS